MSRRIQPRLFSGLAVVAATLLLALPAFADAVGPEGPIDKVIPLDIARTSLDEALRALAKQANLQIVFDAALVSGRVVPALKERTSPRLVIHRWLSGTNLIAEEQPPGVIVVREGAVRERLGARKNKAIAPVKENR